MQKIFVIVGIALLLAGVVLSIYSVTTTLDDSFPAFEEFMRMFQAPEQPMHLSSGETVTASIDVSGTPPEDYVVFGVTTSENFNSVAVNSSIFDETFVAGELYAYVVCTAESDEGGLLVFSWSVSQEDSVYFGVFDSEGQMNFWADITSANFETHALLYGNLQEGIGYIVAPKEDTYAFILLNYNEQQEWVTVEVMQVTNASVPYLESAEGKTHAALTYTTTNEDDYIIVIELPDGTYTVSLNAELSPKYPYQVFGFILLAVGAIVTVYGFIAKPKPSQTVVPQNV
jgi:hypothetical protein